MMHGHTYIKSQKKLCFGTRRSHEFESQTGHWLQWTSFFHILPSSSLLIILPSDDTLQATDLHIFQRCRQPSQNSTRQMADLKQVPYLSMEFFGALRPQKISVATVQKFCRPGSVYPWTASLNKSTNATATRSYSFAQIIFPTSAFGCIMITFPEQLKLPP